MKKRSKIKILVTFHKPYKIIKNEFLLPIHVGREIAFKKNKDGVISQKDYKWLIKNTIGDNTGENISELNRDYCELTAIYWAWKNYDKIGNPDYIGLFHYRTFLDLDFSTLKDSLILNDGIIPSYINAIEFSGNKDYINSALEHDLKYISDICPQLDQALDLFRKTGNVHYKNMFILKKEDFMEYCSLLFSILDYIKPKLSGQPREIGYTAEGISSIIFDYFALNKSRKFKYCLFKTLDRPQKNIFNILKFLLYSSFLIFNKSKFSLNAHKYKQKLLGLYDAPETNAQKQFLYKQKDKNNV